MSEKDDRNAPRLHNLVKPARVAWSGDGGVPRVGAQVTVGFNGLGDATVLGYFIQDGGQQLWLGLRVELEDPPEWFIRQNGENRDCHVFGRELKED